MMELQAPIRSSSFAIGPTGKTYRKVELIGKIVTHAPPVMLHEFGLRNRLLPVRCFYFQLVTESPIWVD